MSLTATEKRLVELYRAADSETKKKALSLLRGTEDDAAAALPNVNDIIGAIIEGVLK